LKEELIDFCRQEGLSRRGGKIEIADRIEHYLRTSSKEASVKTQKSKPTSHFDWAAATLMLETVITDNYKNSENVRAFFQEQVDGKFKFNVKFMNWMKRNVGKTLADAVDEWQRIELEKKSSKKRKEIAPQFEYNRYIRDFLEDNPGTSKEVAVQYWKVKRGIRGDNVYRKSDLGLKIEGNEV
jgi:hypothetical protein